MDKLVDSFLRYPSLPLLFGAGAVYTAYYYSFVAKKPQVGANRVFRAFLDRYCPIVNERFWPTPWCFESRSQTIVRSAIKSCPDVAYVKEILQMADGGQVAIDWVHNEASPHSADVRPTVLVLPGLTGSSDQSYARHLCRQATCLGYRAVVFNYRGNGGAKLLTPRTYNATNTEDLSCVIAHIKRRFPRAPLVACGISLGGLILTNYLSKAGEKSRLVAAMSVSAAWNLFESMKTIEAPIVPLLFNNRLASHLVDSVKRVILTNYLAGPAEGAGLAAGMCVSSPWDCFESAVSLERPLDTMLFNRWLTQHLVMAVQRNVHLFQGMNQYNLEHVFRSRTIREFDDRFTSKQFGYPTYREYYADACIHRKVSDIRVPLLCLNAADDPFSPAHAIPVEEACDSKCVAIVLTSHGGHIGFLEGLLPRHANYMDRLFAQFVDAIFRHRAELMRDLQSSYGKDTVRGAS